MLTEEQYTSNKQEFIELISGINRDNADIEKLIRQLEKLDFFEAPASAKYHNACKGGLCDHSLNVYYNLKHLLSYKQGLPEECYNEDSIRIVSLLHDISKMNMYELSSRNKKVYCENGSKSDNLGTFEWVSELSYKKKDDTELLTYGNHEMTSEYMVRQFIPLTIQESVAILHHMGAMHYDCAQDNISVVFTKYPLSLLLHQADMLATYIDEVR